MAPVSPRQKSTYALPSTSRKLAPCADSTKTGNGPAHLAIQFMGTPPGSERRARSWSARDRGCPATKRRSSRAIRSGRRERSRVLTDLQLLLFSLRTVARARPASRGSAAGRGPRPAAAPPPAAEERAQLRLDREADAVVHAEQATVRQGQQVAPLAIGVVDHRVEEGDAPQPRGAGAERLDEVHLRVRLDPLLGHPGTQGAGLAERGRRNHVPSGGLRDEVCGHLAVGERAVGEVPQRPLPGDGLVDAADPGAAARGGAAPPQWT